MNLFISCPQCGYNEYRALNTETNTEVTIIISKCETTGCDLDIPQDEFYNKFENQCDLCIPSRYTILEQTHTDCLDDDSLN